LPHSRATEDPPAPLICQAVFHCQATMSVSCLNVPLVFLIIFYHLQPNFSRGFRKLPLRFSAYE
jgi:hypothetical protein